MQGAPCKPVSHPHRVTSTKCRINRAVSADDGHIVARNMYRKEIDILRKIMHQVGFIYKTVSYCLNFPFYFFHFLYSSFSWAEISPNNI